MLDLAAIYIVLIEKVEPDTNRKNEIISKFCIYLNNGYTYEQLRKAILEAFHSKQLFPHYRYDKPNKQDGNLLQQGVMYYHKELKLMNTLPIINHDIDRGTMTSKKVEYYLEPVASYTMDDLLKYFYSKGMADTQEFNYKRMAGLFKHMIDKYGLDKLLFMIEGASRMFEAEHKVFTITDFDSYSSTASQYLEEIKNNCKYSGGDKYVTRKRNLGFNK